MVRKRIFGTILAVLFVGILTGCPEAAAPSAEDVKTEDVRQSGQAGTEDTCIIAEKEDGFSFFDNEGNEVSSGAWDWVSWVLGEKGVSYITQDDRKGFADRNGKVILEPIYEYIRPIAEKELVIVRNEKEEYGILDYEGEVRVPFGYKEISYQDEAGGLYVIDADTGKAGYLDGEDFLVKIPVIYDRLWDFTEDRAIALLGEKCGVVRYDGTVEVPIEYDRISLFSDGSMAAWTGETVMQRRVFWGIDTNIGTGKEN